MKWDTDVSYYKSLVGLKDSPTMTQEVEVMIPLNDSEDSLSSDDSDNPRVPLKCADHHNCRCNTLTQFLINDDAKDSDLMEMDLDNLQSVQNEWNDHSRGNDGPPNTWVKKKTMMTENC